VSNDLKRYDDPEQYANALQLLADLVRSGMPQVEYVHIQHSRIAASMHTNPDGLRAWAALLGVEPGPWRSLSTNSRERLVNGVYASHAIHIVAYDDLPGVVVVQVDDTKLQQAESVKGERWDGELPQGLCREER